MKSSQIRLQILEIIDELFYNAVKKNHHEKPFEQGFSGSGNRPGF